MSDNLKTWPEKIYMQHGAEDEVADFSDCYDSVTWCADQIESTDVEYVRADLVAPQRTAQSEDARDAARYRWLASRFSGYDFYWGGNPDAETEEGKGIIIAAFELEKSFVGTRDISSSIDAAMQKESGTNDGGLHYCITCERHVSRPCTSVDCSTPDTLSTAMQKESGK